MKKRIYLYSLIGLFTGLFIITYNSCMRESGNSKSLTEAKLDEFIDAAGIHFQGLQMFYDDVLSTGNATRDGSVVITEAELESYSLDITNKITAKDARLSDLEKRYAFSDIDAPITKGGTDFDREELEAYLSEALDELSEPGLNEYSIIKNRILKIMGRAAFADFPEEHQNFLTLAFAVYLDSYQYWSEHLDEWGNLTGIDYEDGTRGHLTSGERAMMRDAANSGLAESDLWGLLGSLLGAPFGAFGFAVGWASGAINSSIGTALGIGS